MEWIKIPADMPGHRKRDLLPKDRQFLALWKGTPSLMEWDGEDSTFWISFLPASMGAWKLSVEREGKITHWCDLEMPKDY